MRWITIDDGRWPIDDGRSSSFDDFVRAQAARAHANTPDTTANQGANGLQIGFEPARPDVMGMADRSSDDGLAAADSTLFRRSEERRVGKEWRSGLGAEH